MHLVTVIDERCDEDVLCTALRCFVNRDLMDATTHLMEGVAWTPMKVAYAERLRGLNDQRQVWDEEPALIRGVLDDSWR